MAQPTEPTTLVAMLAGQAARRPEQTAFSFLGESCSYHELWHRARQLAGGLLAQGLAPGDRVVLALPNGAEFFAAFYGTIAAGGIAVPVFPGSGPERVATIAGLCGAAALLLPAATTTEVRHRLAELVAPSCVVLDAGSSSAGNGVPALPDVAADEICFIQYTSGSTGNPKGVQLSHANLLTNVRQMITGMAITHHDRFVSWLPVYHDMGLILMTMVPFYLAARLVLLPTSLVSIRSWLRTINDERGSFTAAPDFAYRLCLRYVSDPGSLDLSCLRVALNAAEPVRAATIEQFEQAFGLTGVMVPGYGLAEATVGVCMWPPGSRAAVHARGLVALGRPFPGVEMRIAGVDGPAPPGQVGEIEVKSLAATCGYLHNPEATAELLTVDGFLRTGDLGLTDEAGELFFVGRRKSIIIHGGQNLAPQEVEETVDELDFVRCTAAVGIDRGRLEGEQVYVFAELRAPLLGQQDRWPALVVEIVSCFHNRLGFRPGRVYLLAPRAIPLTHNGKVRHALLREQYLDGSLRSTGLLLFPEH